MIIKIEPEFVAWLNLSLERHEIRVELVDGETNEVRVTTSRGSYRNGVRDNADLGQLMAAVLECDQAQERMAAMRKRAAEAAA